MIYDASGAVWTAPGDVIGHTIESRSAQMEANRRQIERLLAEAMYGHGPEDRVRDLRRSVGAPVTDTGLDGLSAFVGAPA